MTLSQPAADAIGRIRALLSKHIKKYCDHRVDFDTVRHSIIYEILRCLQLHQSTCFGTSRKISSKRRFSFRLGINTLAAMLLRQLGMRSGSDLAAGVSCYGDAILVTDTRMHWIFSNSKVDAEEFEVFDAMLSTPRQIVIPWKNHNPIIFFHEEPNYVDLVALKMRWA